MIVCAAHVFDGETIGYLAARSIRSSRSIYVIKRSSSSHNNTFALTYGSRTSACMVGQGGCRRAGP